MAIVLYHAVYRYLLALAPLALITILVGTAYASTMELLPTDDAYVVNDFNDPTNKQGLQTLNTGNLTFLKVWYSWNVNDAGNKILSIAYLNFDLSGLSRDQINAARLDMYAQQVKLTAASRAVSVYVASISPWKESTLTYQNKPSFSTNATATASVSLTGWYGWDITSAAKEKAGSKLTLVVLLPDIMNKNEEIVGFTSKEGDPAHAPRLVIDTSAGQGLLGSDYSIRILGAGITLAVGGGLVGFILYRRRNQQRSSLQISSKASSVETAELCQNCGRNVSQDSNICYFCGHDLTHIKCASCGEDISKDHKVCPHCGGRVNHDQQL